jgi:hypothetical protein
MAFNRREQLVRFYSLLDQLERDIGGARKLADCSGRMKWPTRGVCFFREEGEPRSDTGTGPRIVRVGTHALRSWKSSHMGKSCATRRCEMQSSFRRLVLRTQGRRHRAALRRIHNARTRVHKYRVCSNFIRKINGAGAATQILPLRPTRQ